MLLAGWAACAAPAAGPASGTAAKDTATDVIDTPAAAPTWTADYALDRLVGLGEFPLALTIQGAYLAAMAGGDSACPGSETQMSIPAEGCYAENGTWFEGSAFYRQDDWEDAGGRWEVTELGGDFGIAPLTTDPFDAGGSVGDRRNTLGSVVRRISDVRGTFVDGASEGALRRGVSSFLIVTDEVTGDALSLEGTISLEDLNLAFSAFTLQTGCASGRASVRDPVGIWYDFDFGDSCATCGTSRFDGQDLGEACPDFSGLASAVRVDLPP